MKYCTLVLAAASLMGAEESTRTIEKSFPLTGSGRSLFVCGVNGALRVTATNGNEVRFTVREKLEARDRSVLDELKREVDFVFAQDGNGVRAGVKGPWSSSDCTQQNRDGRRDGRRWDGRDTRIEHDITVSVPRDAKLELRNVNGGIEVNGTAGPYSVKTVNGGVRMNDVEGSGDVGTVNGSVTAVYKQNPSAASTFKTVNGKLDLYFQPQLNADFKVKTVNGKVFTDYEMTSIPVTTTASNENSGMRVIHRRGGIGEVRAGSGGPKFSAETVNGSILIHSLDKGRP